MSRRRIVTLAPLLLFLACGRGQVSGLDPSDPLGGSDGGGIIPRDVGVDGGVRPDATDPLDGDVPDRPRPDRPDVPPLPDGGDLVCQDELDCWDRFGPPPCPQDGRWICEPDPSGQGFCRPECAPPPPQCFNDCDCPFELSCARGECQPLNRRNLCCEAPFCPAGELCVLPGGGRDTCPNGPPPPDAGVPDGGPLDAGGPDAGPAFTVGSACAGPMSCAPGFCIEEDNGFPGGYCTDQCGPNGACPAGSSCQDFGQGQQLCLDACQTAADCRPGYACTALGFATGRVCWPEVPTSSNPNGAPVGDGCFDTEDCNQGLSCFEDWPGGYCTRFYCDPQSSPCPGSSQCFAFPGSFSLCLDGCASGGSQSDCRPGYYCLGPTGQPGVCISN